MAFYGAPEAVVVVAGHEDVAIRRRSLWPSTSRALAHIDRPMSGSGGVDDLRLRLRRVLDVGEVAHVDVDLGAAERPQDANEVSQQGIVDAPDQAADGTAAVAAELAHECTFSDQAFQN